MYTKSLSFLAILAIIGFCQAQIVSVGKCPTDIVPQQDFKLTEYLGTWYEYAKYPNTMELNGICNTAQYSRLSEHIVQVNNTLLNLSTLKYDSFVAVADVVGSGQLNVVRPGVKYVPGKTNYQVLSTDYDNYSVVYSCEQPMEQVNFKFAWILTRKRKADVAIVEKAINVLNANNLSTQDLSVSSQVC